MAHLSALLGFLVAIAATTPAAALLNGRSELGFSEVVFIEPLPDGHSLGDCSGVVITPKVVLTAAHCLSGRDFDPPKTLAARVLIADRPNTLPRMVEALGFFRSPDYAFAISLRDRDYALARTAANDWGLLFFEHPLGVSPPTRIDQLLPPDLRARLKERPIAVQNAATVDGDATLDGALQAWFRETFFAHGDLEALVVGYGFDQCTREAVGVSCTGKGVKRSALVRAGSDPKCGRTTFPYSDAFPVSVLCITAVDGGHIPITFADSGGPIYLRSKEGKWILAGIVSVGTATGFTGTDAHLAASILLFMDDLEQQLQNERPRNTIPYDVAPVR